MSVSEDDILATLRANPFLQVSDGSESWWLLGEEEIRLTPEMEWRLMATALRLAQPRGIEGLRAAEQLAWERYVETREVAL